MTSLASAIEILPIQNRRAFEAHLRGGGKVSPTRKLQSLGLFEPRGLRVSVQFARSDATLHLRAAQYVRMSTDHQQYSTENQAATIAAYAAQRNLRIVREYADEGRSGLRME